MLQYSFTWNQLSAVAGISFWNIYFKLVQGAVRAPEVVAFLKALRRHLGDRKLLIVWDRLQAHRSRLVREYVESQEGAIHLEFLPPYAPELNPVEYLWAHWKHHELANFCPKDFAELTVHARAKLRRTQRRKLEDRAELMHRGQSLWQGRHQPGRCASAVRSLCVSKRKARHASRDDHVGSAAA